jgi:two-component system, NtrC family, sensor kinase
MIALGLLVSGVAHEINIPNVFVIMNTPILKSPWNGITPILEQYSRANGDFSIDGFSYSEMKESIPALFEGVQDGATGANGFFPPRIRRYQKGCRYQYRR